MAFILSADEMADTTNEIVEILIRVHFPGTELENTPEGEVHE